MTLPGMLRAVRRPLVALCAVLLVANVLLPATSPGGVEAGLWCHGAAPVSPGENGPAVHPYNTCCFSAALAFMPTGAMRLSPPAPRLSPAVAAPTAAARLRHPGGTARIRAPPFV